MKKVKADYRIDDMPQGEEALAKIERMGRIAYKSEDRIDDGRDPCPHCGAAEAGDSVRTSCLPCYGRGWNQVREPSSHKFVRMILKAERKAKLIVLGEKILRNGWQNAKKLSAQLVSSIVDYMRENPAHESVIEHCSASVVFTSNRGFTHEIVRHRLASFTQESSRYCDYNSGRFGGEVSVIDRDFWGTPLDNESEAELSIRLERASRIWTTAMQQAEAAYATLRSLHIPPEIARDVLPQATKADIAVTANFREWQHVFALRDSPRAHPDMRKLLSPLHEDFRKRIPIVFDDF